MVKKKETKKKEKKKGFSETMKEVGKKIKDTNDAMDKAMKDIDWGEE